MGYESIGDSGKSKRSTNSGLLKIIYDPKIRGVFFQFILLALVFLLFVWIINNTIINIGSQGKKSGFDFLGETAGFSILKTPGTWLVDLVLEAVGEYSYWEVFIIGVVNTFAVSFLGIIAATILGFIIGVFRLSSNFVLRGFGAVYVEVLRNIPLLVQLLLWYKVVISFLPNKRGEEPIRFFGEAAPNVGVLDKSGLWAPYPLPEQGFSLTLAAFAIGLIGWIVLSVWAKRRQDATGEGFPTFWVGLGIFIGLPVIVFLASGSPLEWEQPLRGRFGFRDGHGMVMKPEFFAVFLGLTLYTAAFIAEIVRAGVLAVNKGQTEAAYALGLRPQKTLSLVVIPQALRVIIPPLTSQFLNLTKNSSLAVAIAYPDVVSVFAGTALNQVGQEVEMIFMMMIVYLLFSLSISAFMNWYNKSIALVER